MMFTRRQLLTSAAALGGTTLLDTRATAAPAGSAIPTVPTQPHFDAPPNQGPFPYVPNETLDGVTLPWKLDNGVKVFHLVAEDPGWYKHPPGTQAYKLK